MLGPPIHVTSATDPRLADYHALKEQRLREGGGKFIAESEGVVRRLLASSLSLDSVLVTHTKWQALQVHPCDGPGRPSFPTYVVDQAVMDQVAGFHVHRGCLAVGLRPADPQLPTTPRLIIALEDLVDVENVGGVIRNAAAFGADGVLLSPKTADPYYRKAIRVAMGNTFFLPIVRAQQWPEDLIAVARRHDASLVGAVVQPEGAIGLAKFTPPRAAVLVVGAEGPGLSQATRALCDQLVTIPMVNADSLNVATAAAVMLYHFSQLNVPHEESKGVT